LLKSRHRPVQIDIVDAVILHVEAGTKLKQRRDSSLDISLLPDVGLRTPVIILRIVDFPEPFVPMMPTVSPLYIVISTLIESPVDRVQAFMSKPKRLTKPIRISVVELILLNKILDLDDRLSNIR
jgi:hypothetical protein